MNIKVVYLYRDYSNYKNWGEIIFENPENISIGTIENQIRECLIEGEWFYAHEWEIPDLHFKTWNIEDDHCWHEFADVEETTEPATTHNSLKEFLQKIKEAKNKLA
jgi:hypothetical protein